MNWRQPVGSMLLLVGVAALTQLSCVLLDPVPGPDPVGLPPGQGQVPSDTSASLQKGRSEYVRLCSRCHGDSAQGNSIGPSIARRSGIAVIVRNGKGSMPAQPGVTDAQLRSIELFLASVTLPGGSGGGTDTVFTQGARLFAGLCARCHSDSADGGIGPNIQHFVGISRSVRFGKGSMPAFPQLSATDIANIEYFLSRVNGSSGGQEP